MCDHERPVEKPVRTGMLRKDFLASFFLGAYASQEGQGFGLSYFLFVCCYLVGLWGSTKGEEE